MSLIDKIHRFLLLSTGDRIYNNKYDKERKELYKEIKLLKYASKNN